MSRAEMNPARRTPTSAAASNIPGACDRADLNDWAGRGGHLPNSLAAHVAECRGCAAKVRQISQVHAALGLMRTQSMPVDLPARANGRALRMLRRAARASAAAQRLLRMRPNLSIWQRAQIYTARLTLTAAAAGLMLVVRIGLFSGFEHTREMGRTLAMRHWERHIDGTGEWLGPPPMA
jgi:hypothetical protein